MTPHSLRTFCATMLLDAGVEPRRVADQLGHSSPVITLQHYAGRSAHSDLSDILGGICA